MNAIEKWNRIVDLHKQYFRSPESTVQSVWENVFVEILGYSRLEGEVERHRSIYLGSTERIIPDIIVKNQEADLFVVELKQHNAPFVPGMESQLFSYLKQLRNNVGILICDKLYAYSYDYGKKDEEQLKVEIPFVENHADGVKLVEIFSKGGFDSKKVKAFVFEKNQFDLNVKSISKRITPALVAELIKECFAPNFAEEEIHAALAGFEITVSEKGKNNMEIYRPVSKVGFDTAVRPIELESSIKKSEAIAELRKVDVAVPRRCTFASLNKNGRFYWANPDVSVLNSDWWIILNDGRRRELHCFMVYANALTENQFHIRKDRNAIDFEIIYGSNAFIDNRSKISFAPWLVKTVKY